MVLVDLTSTLVLLFTQLNIVSLFPPNRDDPINNKYMSFLKEGQAAA